MFYMSILSYYPTKVHCPLRMYCISYANVFSSRLTLHEWLKMLHKTLVALEDWNKIYIFIHMIENLLLP